MGSQIKFNRAEVSEDNRRLGTITFESYAGGMSKTWAFESKAGFACLLEAAPDLLSILEDLISPESGCRLTNHGKASIRAAIKKAKGER